MDDSDSSPREKAQLRIQRFLKGVDREVEGVPDPHINPSGISRGSYYRGARQTAPTKKRHHLYEP